MLRAMAFTWLPAAAAAVLYGALLGYRRDYLGHFAAGYGGTLASLVFTLALLSVCARRAPGSPAAEAVPSEAAPCERAPYERALPLAVLGVSLACIGLGAVCELTVFRMAKFDEVDFCNQSTGAVLAGLAVLAGFGGVPAGWAACLGGGAAGTAFLGLGFYYAFS